MSNALAKLSEKNIVIGKFRLAQTGLVIDGNPTYEEWEDCGTFLTQAEKAVQFWIGDWLNYGENKYGEMYSQAVEETGYDNGTLRNYKYVAGAVELSRRHDNLSFTHHQEVAGLEPEQQKILLDKAECDGLSSRELRQEVWNIKAEDNRPAIILDKEQYKAKLKVGDMLDIVPTLGKFDLIVTDPPYGVTDYEWDVLETQKWLDVIIPQLKDEYNIFWFCAPQFTSDIELIFRAMKLPIQSRLVWHRRNMAMGSHARNKFIDTWEMIIHAGNRELNFPAEWSDAWFDVQTFAVPQSNFTDKKYHPTQKPEALIQRLIEFGSYPGDRILDPFAGSGTTGAVCPGDRQCVLVEKDVEYARIIKNRLGI